LYFSEYVKKNDHNHSFEDAYMGNVDIDPIYDEYSSLPEDGVEKYDLFDIPGGEITHQCPVPDMDHELIETLHENHFQHQEEMLESSQQGIQENVQQSRGFLFN
jgi:hypothetical protein